MVNINGEIDLSMRVISVSTFVVRFWVLQYFFVEGIEHTNQAVKKIVQSDSCPINIKTYAGSNSVLLVQSDMDKIQVKS